MSFILLVKIAAATPPVEPAAGLPAPPEFWFPDGVELPPPPAWVVPEAEMVRRLTAAGWVPDCRGWKTEASQYVSAYCTVSRGGVQGILSLTGSTLAGDRMAGADVQVSDGQYWSLIARASDPATLQTFVARWAPVLGTLDGTRIEAALTADGWGRRPEVDRVYLPGPQTYTRADGSVLSVEIRDTPGPVDRFDIQNGMGAGWVGQEIGWTVELSEGPAARALLEAIVAPASQPPAGPGPAKVYEKRKVPPTYPKAAKRARLGRATCIVEVVIDPHGNAANARAVTGCPEAFWPEALRVVALWKWYPVKDGKTAIEVVAQVPVEFDPKAR